MGLDWVVSDWMGLDCVPGGGVTVLKLTTNVPSASPHLRRPSTGSAGPYRPPHPTPPPTSLSPSLLKSALQKNVRLGRVNPSVSLLRLFRV
jgi:hypothetical protein